MLSSLLNSLPLLACSAIVGCFVPVISYSLGEEVFAEIQPERSLRQFSILSSSCDIGRLGEELVSLW